MSIMPILIGSIGNYIIPIVIGTREMGWPRMNAIGFWLLPVSFILLILSTLLDTRY